MMRRSNFFARVVTFSMGSALLASCGGGQAPSISPLGSAYETATAQRARPDTGYDVLYSFGRTGARHPYAGLASDGTTLYGTTDLGGSPDCYEGCGTVYAITTAGTKTTIHKFIGGTTDGAHPVTEVTYAGGTLYGTTSAGGSGTGCNDGCGTVYSITPSGKETLLYSFIGGTSDGAYPSNALIDVKGTLYGSTLVGGAYNQGTIFSISPTGEETVLHSFAGEPNDGSNPSSPLFNVGGRLYGTTARGGANNLGTVFSISTSGTESTLYSFKGGTSDGSIPTSLVALDGTLFGATYDGGAPCKTPHNGCGTFFKMSVTGSEKVLHDFTNDEGSKSKNLTTEGGAIYGTAYYGGTGFRGTLFKVSTKGALTVLHTFGKPLTGGGSDGKHPVGQLLILNGTIYGATQTGGSYNKGTVYTLTS